MHKSDSSLFLLYRLYSAASLASDPTPSAGVAGGESIFK